MFIGFFVGTPPIRSCAHTQNVGNPLGDSAGHGNVDSDGNRRRDVTPVEELDQDLVGTVGQVTVPITSTRPGEVLLPVRGGTEAFAACADEPIAKYARVVVVECLSGRTVSVTPVS
jgi:hypothetical protein